MAELERNHSVTPYEISSASHHQREAACTWPCSVSTSLEVGQPDTVSSLGNEQYHV